MRRGRSNHPPRRRCAHLRLQCIHGRQVRPSPHRASWLTRRSCFNNSDGDFLIGLVAALAAARSTALQCRSKARSRCAPNLAFCTLSPTKLLSCRCALSRVRHPAQSFAARHPIRRRGRGPQPVLLRLPHECLLICLARSGYICEIFGSAFRLPNLGPIGALAAGAMKDC